jgi:uncharacterized BrkB/YihY/UPF0761 family membrane protein
MSGAATPGLILLIVGFLVAVVGILLGLVGYVASIRTGDPYPVDPRRWLQFSVRWPYLLQYPLLLIGFGLMWLSGRM